MSDLDLAIAIAKAKAKAAATAPDGTITPEQRAANIAAASEKQAGIDQIAQDQVTLAQNPAIINGLTKFNQGVPFIGQWTDEAAGALGGPDALARARALQDAMGRQYPKTSMALGAAGGLAGALVASPGIGALPQASSMLGKAAVGLGAGATLGAAEGAVSGAGMANEGSRARGALVGGATGAAIGGVLGGVAPMAVAGIKNLAQLWTGKDTRTIAKVLGISPSAARIVKESLSAEDMGAAMVALKRAGADAVLGDAGYATKQALDTAISTGGKATAIGRGFVDARAAKANGRLTSVMDAILGAPEGLKAGMKAIATKTAAVRQTAYDRAYAQPIDYAAPTGQAVEAVIARVPRDQLTAAIKEANDAMRVAGVKNPQIMATIADDGTVSFQEMPNLQQMDYLKRGLDAVGRKETDAMTGKVSDAGRRAQQLAGDLRAALMDAVPGYRTAVKLGGDKIADEQGLILGRKLLSPQVTRETVMEQLANASRETRQAAQRGLRTAIDEIMANTRDYVSMPGLDIRQVAEALGPMTSKASRDKISQVVGPAAARKLFDVLEEAAAHLELRAAVARGSQTAIRQSGQAGYTAVMDGGGLQALKQGEPLNAMKRITQALTDTTPAAMSDQKQALAAEIAQALTTMKGPQAEAALASITKAMQGQALSSQEALNIARAVIGSGVGGAYQPAQQGLNQLVNGPQ